MYKMKTWLSICILLIFMMVSCESKVRQADYDKLKSELEECKRTVDDLQNTPEIRLAKGQEYLSHNDLDSAKSELKTLIEKYADSEEAIKAKAIIKKIDLQIKEKEIAAERKRTLGYKVLKERNTVVVGNITLNFKSVTAGSKWIFEYDKNDYYRYRSAERGNTFILANVSFSSKVKESKIPLISVYKLSSGALTLIGTMKREFLEEAENIVTDKDFKYVSKVNFSQALEISKKTLESNAVFVVVKKENCSKYSMGYYLDSDASNCYLKSPLSIDDFDNEYVLIKILNKNKL